MDKLMQIADQAATQKTSSLTASMPVCPENFSAFMKQNPIWNFYKISKSDYMVMPDGEKMKLIDGYYKHMSNGKSKFNFWSSLIHLSLLDLAK